METLDHGSIGKMSILPIRQRWNLLVIGIGISLVLVIVQLFQGFDTLDLVHRAQKGDVGAAYKIELSKKDGFSPVELLFFLVGVASIVFSCMWFYRASQNVHKAGMKHLNNSPGWNVGWFFIPLINIVMPVVVVRETMKASQSINQPNDYSAWPNNTAIGAFRIWAICFIVRMASVYGMMFFAFSYARRIALGDADALLEMEEIAVYYTFVSAAFSVIEGTALLLFSKKLTDLQEEYRNDN